MLSNFTVVTVTLFFPPHKPSCRRWNHCCFQCGALFGSQRNSVLSSTSVAKGGAPTGSKLLLLVRRCVKEVQNNKSQAFFCASRDRRWTARLQDPFHCCLQSNIKPSVLAARNGRLGYDKRRMLSDSNP